MKKTIFAAASLILITTLNSQGGYKPGGCSTYVSCPQDIKDGPEICTHPNDKTKVIIKANKKNGKLEGDFWCAKESGEPHVKAHYKNDEYDGVYEEYDPGLKDWATVINYKNGKREGLSTRKISDGRKIIRFYKEDKEYGFELILDKDGKLQSLSDCEINNTRKNEEECKDIYIPGYEALIKKYFADKAAAQKADDNRVVEKKFKNGKIAEKYKYVDGQREGDHEIYYENGQLENIRKYKAGKIQEEKSFFDDGKLKAHIIYDGRVATEEKNYYQNGKMKSEKKFSREEKWTTKMIYKEYYDNGKVSEEGTRIIFAAGWNRDGVPEGEIKGYTEDGKLAYIANYKNQKLDGLQTTVAKEQIYKTLYAKGVLVEETIFDSATNKQLSHKTFYPDGSVKSENKN